MTRTVRLRDRFADHGIISVFFGCVQDDTLLVDAWLMSCRVLGRGVERLLFNDVLAEARARGLAQIVGIYRPTDRNMLVKDHYANLGFSRQPGEGPTEQWWLRVADAMVLETCIGVDDALRERPAIR